MPAALSHDDRLLNEFPIHFLYMVFAHSNFITHLPHSLPAQAARFVAKARAALRTGFLHYAYGNAQTARVRVFATVNPLSPGGQGRVSLI